MKFILSLVCCSFLIVSCGDNYEAQQKAHQAVMEIHDEVMPKTADIQRLIRALKKHIKEDTVLDENSSAMITASIKQLEEADEAMLSWMSNYKQPKKDMPKEEALNYLKEEKEKITEVRSMMLESISVSKILLSKLQK